MKPTFLIMILTLFSSLSFGQGEANIWYFGNKAGLDFNTIPPSILTTSKMNTSEGCASIADEKGNLLFYTDGITVWNRQHGIMLNGEELKGNSSSTQSAIIVKSIVNSSEYYIFTVDGLTGGKQGAHYSIVDMNLAGGLGAITTKNEFILGQTSEKITVITHANGIDKWVIIRKESENKFYSYLLSSAGVEKTSVISNIGILAKTGVGYLKSSLDGTLVLDVELGKGIEIFDFDNSTGKLSNARELSNANEPIGVYGCEFSPSGRFVYVSDWGITGGGTIFQYDLSLQDINKIRASQYKLTQQPFYIGALQLAPDGKIYIAQFDKSNLHVINYPDSKGDLCGFEANYVNLGTGLSKSGLPTFYTSLINLSMIHVNNLCINMNTEFNVTLGNVDNIDSLRWDFGDPLSGHNNFSTSRSPSHIYTQSGEYTVKLVVYHVNGILNFQKKFRLSPSLSFDIKDTIVCPSEGVSYDMEYLTSDSLKWSTDENDVLFEVYDSGEYWLKAYNGGCFFTDSFQVSYPLPPNVNLGFDTILCPNTTLWVTPKIQTGRVKYLWNDGDTNMIKKIEQTGSYILTVSLLNCEEVFFNDTIDVVFYPALPDLKITSDSLLCENETIKINTNYSGYYQLVWQDGSSGSTYIATTPGLYEVETQDYGCGVVSDSIRIKYLSGPCIHIYFPNAFTPNADGKNDTFFPLGDEIEVEIMQIFTRWGELIYNGSGPWDGMYQGVTVPSGAYLYVVIYQEQSGLKQYTKGTVQVLR